MREIANLKRLYQDADRVMNSEPDSPGMSTGTDSSGRAALGHGTADTDENRDVHQPEAV